MIAKSKQDSMGSYPKKRSLDEVGRDSILSLTAGYFASQHPEIIAAYVFGSFARQEAFGDLDVAALIAARLAEPLEFELELERDLEKLVRIPADVRILNEAPRSFQYTVIRQGKVLLDRDPNRRAAFEGNVIKQYLDFSRFRRRCLKEIAHAEI
jgi:predicted nucleotidyltransferase